MDYCKLIHCPTIYIFFCFFILFLLSVSVIESCRPFVVKNAFKNGKNFYLNINWKHVNEKKLDEKKNTHKQINQYLYNKMNKKEKNE